MKNLLANRNKGFTLVELIVVIVIIAVLIAALTPAILGVIRRANESANEADGRQVMLAAATALLAGGPLIDDVYSRNRITAEIGAHSMQVGLQVRVFMDGQITTGFQIRGGGRTPHPVRDNDGGGNIVGRSTGSHVDYTIVASPTTP